MSVLAMYGTLRQRLPSAATAASIARHSSPLLPQLRHYKPTEDEPPIGAKSFAERMAVAPFITRPRRPVDIGFRMASSSSMRRSRRNRRRTTSAAAAAALSGSGEDGGVCLESLDREWLRESPGQLRTVARHYAIYRHMFGAAEFLPVVPLRVEYAAAAGGGGGGAASGATTDEWPMCHVAARGNIIKPAEARGQPAVSFQWRWPDAAAAADGSSSSSSSGSGFSAAHTGERDQCDVHHHQQQQEQQPRRRKTLWTLTCSSLEGGVEHDGAESLLWLVQNIASEDDHVVVSECDSPGGSRGRGVEELRSGPGVVGGGGGGGGEVGRDVAGQNGGAEYARVVNGTEVFTYRQPLPVRGTGFHRVAFVLYRHVPLEGAASDTINGGSGEAVAPPSIDATPLVASHTGPGPAAFSTEHFYRRHQHQLTPAGLAFFQTDWDESVQQFWHRQLQLPEPIYEYNFAPPYVNQQPWIPAGQSVQHFFDKHADPRHIQHQMLVKRLARVHPFRGTTPPYRYPLATLLDRPVKSVSWVYNEERKEAQRFGKYYFIDRRLTQLFNPYC